MKSEHRHELETNWLAHHTAIWLERLQPYNSLIVGALLTVAILMFAYSYFGGETTARESAAWNSYNQAVEGMVPNLDQLHESADEYPDSPMQQFADVTWADGQLALASQLYIRNRPAANEAINRAIGAYQGLLRESKDERIQSRAHFGLGRVYELMNDLEKARAEYLAVKGGFAKLAADRAKELEEQDIKDVYAWLATAEGPRRTAPLGPGTPGQRPGFAPGEIELPAASTSTEASDAPISVDDLFEGIGETGKAGEVDLTNRYEEGAPSAEVPAGNATQTEATEDGSATGSAADDAKPKE